MQLQQVLLIDIPEIEELTGAPEDKILALKWKAEALLSPRAYATHMSSVKFSRGLLTMAATLQSYGVKVRYLSVNAELDNSRRKSVENCRNNGIAHKRLGEEPQLVFGRIGCGE